MEREMISVEEAASIILDHAHPLAPVQLELLDAAGLMLASDIYAGIDMPAYSQSSMDGYAFSFADLQHNRPLQIQGLSAAGNANEIVHERGTAIRIFTGAPVPPGADTVVMQEKTSTNNGQLLITDQQIVQGQNVRLIGSEIQTGELAVAKHRPLTPAAIGFLAGIGITRVPVYPYPSISMIVTGNELQQPGIPLQPGQVYESNSYSLQAALKQIGITNAKLFTATDDLEVLKKIVEEALAQSDVLFLTGGVSVGDYDFVARAALENGIQKIFHKIKQKPGKPFYFGAKQNKLVFGLPGNPASVLTCFYEYVEPAIKKMIGKGTALQEVHVPLAAAFKKTSGLTHFLKGFFDGSTATPLTAQESYRLSSFANANCLIKIPEDSTGCERGDIVEIHLLPQ